MSRTVKTILFCVLAGVVGFILFVIFALVQLHMDIKTKVYSDRQARESYAQKRKEIAEMIESHFGITVPENAEDLYFSHYGFLMSAKSYAAFRLSSEEECLGFFEQEQIDIKNFRQGKLSQEVPWSKSCMPHTWEEKLQDSNWRLSDDDNILYFDGILPFTGMIYIAEEQRIYLIKETGG